MQRKQDQLDCGQGPRKWNRGRPNQGIAMDGAFIESIIEIVILELENTEVSMMDLVASVAEFGVRYLYFEFSFNLASFNTSFDNI